MQGLGAFNSYDILERVISVDSLEVQHDYQLAARLEELGSLKKGWYGGQGLNLDAKKLNRLSQLLIGHYPEAVAVPAVVPTPEGNLLLEWDAPGDPSVDIDLQSLTAEYHAFSPDYGDVERSFDLATETAVPEFCQFLQDNIQPPAT